MYTKSTHYTLIFVHHIKEQNKKKYQSNFKILVIFIRKTFFVVFKFKKSQ